MVQKGQNQVGRVDGMTEIEAMEIAKRLEDYCYDKNGCDECLFRINTQYKEQPYCSLDGKPNRWNLEFAVGKKN